MKFHVLALTALVALSPMPAASDEAGTKVVVLPFELEDDMKRSPMDADDPVAAGRTAELGTYVARELGKMPAYTVLTDQETTAQAKALAGSRREVRNCMPCITGFAQEIGADLVAVGWVQRVSNLIINFNLRLVDADSGKLLTQVSVDIRNNDDRSWQAGAASLIEQLRGNLPPLAEVTAL